MKKTIDRYLESKNLIEYRAEQVFRIWTKYFNSNHGYFGDVEINNNNEVDIIWADRYDSGTLRVPIKEFCGKWKKWIEDKIEEDKEKQDKVKKKYQDAEIEKEKRLLEKLRMKYEREK